jgi:predicted metal-binding membrane protein
MRSRRLRGMGIFAAVYLGVWVAFGAVVLAVLTVQRSAVRSPEVEALLLPLALAVAAGWQLTRAKRRALIGCRRTVPLPPLGLRADAGCARFALVQARRCLISCWPLMLVMSLVTGLAAAAWMAALTALVVLEDLTPLRGPVRRISAVVLVLSAGAVAVAA